MLHVTAHGLIVRPSKADRAVEDPQRRHDGAEFGAHPIAHPANLLAVAPVLLDSPPDGDRVNARVLGDGIKDPTNFEVEEFEVSPVNGFHYLPLPVRGLIGYP